MGEDCKPPLTPEVWEEIALALYEVDKAYWPRLNALRHSHIVDIAHLTGLGLGAPAPPLPRQPVKLCRILGEYACALFDAEAGRYPSSSVLRDWLQRLAAQTEERVMSAALQGGGIAGSLTYHTTAEQMRATIHVILANHVLH
jgi:hypothetical protein